MLRILCTGENWYGSNSRSCIDAFRRLGCDVFQIDDRAFFPDVRMFTSRAVARLFRFRMVKEFNDRILNIADYFRPDIFVAFKGNYIYANTLQLLSRRGIPLYNFYPDTSAFAHGKWLPKSLPEYDCIFYTKAFWYADVTERIALKGGSLLAHGYNPSLHRPIELDARDISAFGCDVSFIATHTHYKEKLLEQLSSLRPDLNLRIWGNGWTDRCKSIELKRWIKGFALTGELFVKGIRASQINLAIMSGIVAGAHSGDLTTSRTYQIPASGGFMLHERNPEVLDFYRENEEIACFESVEELAEKIDYYLAHPVERENIARAGHARCVPAYSYDNRMAEILRWDQQHRRTAHVELAVAGAATTT
jgi:spore maturation protein CgeB